MQYIPKDSKLHTRCRENLKSHCHFHVSHVYVFSVSPQKKWLTKVCEHTGLLQISYPERNFNNSETRQKTLQPMVSSDTRYCQVSVTNA
jgi:hypothetical protein